MKKLIIAAVAALWMAAQAGAACTTLSSGLGLKLPNYGDRGDVWAKCVRDNFQAMNDGLFPSTAAPNYVLKATPAMTGGLMSTSWANFSSSVTAGAGFYGAFNGSGAGLTAVPAAQLTGGIPAALVNLSTVTTALDGKVAKAGDNMTGQLTTTSSMTAQHVYLANYANPSLIFQGNNVNNGGELVYRRSDDGTNYEWKLWHSPASGDQLYLYRKGPSGVQTWTQDGYVGIGQTSPIYKLDVTGGIRATSSMTAAGFYGGASQLTDTLLVGASVQANIFQSADPATVHQIWVASAVYAVNGGTGGVGGSTATVDGTPIGHIIAYSTTTPPAGYLYCDGSYVSTTTYANLFAVTGHRYSTYTVTGTPSVFQLPDLRGMFMRGAEGNVNGRDPDANRVVGSTQTDTFETHNHGRGSSAGGPSGYGGGSITGDGVAPQTGRVSVETRPKNIAVAYHIKYQHVGSVAISSTVFLVNSTTTYTGANTFTGSVMVSSLTATGDTTFSSPTSTMTVMGWVDFGVMLSTHAATSTVSARAACPSGYAVVSGGCHSGAGNLLMAYFSSDTTNGSVSGSAITSWPGRSWSCVYSSSGNPIVQAVCARIK